MAAREIRAAPRRLLPLTGSVAIGVAALVAIDSFTDNVRDSVRRQAQSLLGADLVLSGRRPFSARPRRCSTLSPLGRGLARVTNFSGMGFVPRTAGTRLVQVEAVERRIPLLRPDRHRPRFRLGRPAGRAPRRRRALVAHSPRRPSG